MYTNALFAAAMVSFATVNAYTQPQQPPTFGSLLTPNGNSPATRGEITQVTWDPTGHTTDGSTVSLVLCHGDSSNCVNEPTAFASNIPAKDASYSWSVPCSLPVGTAKTPTGYGMLIIVDGTGQFQYSTQFSVLAGTKCGSSTNSTSSTTTMTSTKSYTTTSGWSPYNMTTTTKPYTTKVPVPPTTVIVSTTSIAAVVSTPTSTAVSSPSAFKGVATKMSGSAAALVVAAGAAFFAL